MHVIIGVQENDFDWGGGGGGGHQGGGLWFYRSEIFIQAKEV